MTRISYIKKDYPNATLVQLSSSEIINSDDIYIESEMLNATVELSKVLNRLEDCDTLILYSLQTIFCVKDNFNFFMSLRGKKIRLVSVLDRLDTEKDRSFYDHVIRTLEIQRKCRSDYSKKSINERRKNGAKVGRPKVSDEKIKEIQMLRWHAKKSYREISSECNVAIGTVQKYANDKVLEEAFS